MNLTFSAQSAYAAAGPAAPADKLNEIGDRYLAKKQPDEARKAYAAAERIRLQRERGADVK